MFRRHLPSLLALTLLAACSRPAPPLLREGMLPVAGGDSLYYRLVGQGSDTVVVLHGGPALNERYMEVALEPLAASHVLLFYDQRGRGRSTGYRPDSLSFAQDLEDLSLVQAQFQLGPLRLVGHHWGAALGALYAARDPTLVARVVLLSPMPVRVSYTFRLAYMPNDTLAIAAWTQALEQHADSLDPAAFCSRYWGFQFSPAEITAPDVVRQLAPVVCDAPAARLRARAELARQLNRSLPGYDWTDSLRLVTVPALVVVGGESAAWLSNADLWSARMPDARKVVAGKTALFPWVEAESDMNRQIEFFLRGEWPAQALRVDSLGHAVTGA